MKTWAEAYENKSLSLIVEATTYCNAKCPQCLRTDRWGTLGKSTKRPFEINSWSIDDFKSYFSVEDLNHIKNIHFSGTYGDPGMCKDILEIVEYIFQSSSLTTVSMNSNGSMRDEDWWYKLGSIDSDRLKVTFDVDGINQEMHEKYRRGTDLKKVLNNLQSFALSGARVTVLTIIFKHNEKYFDDIVKMVNDYGCFDVLPIESNRFKQGPIWEFKNENGELESLEQSTNPRFRRDPKALRRRTRDHRTVHLAEDYDYITCVKAEAGSLQILNTTQVYPCCYLGSHSEVEPTGIWKSFLNGNFMLKDKSLKEIVNSEWFSYLLFESLEDKSTAMSKCKRICSMKNDEGIIAVS